MADANFNAPPLPAHPMAKPGYGKRTTPGQRARTGPDFGHLPPREAAVAAYLERLPDGTDVSVKMLAKTLPYGQCALRTALNRIQAAGHLRRGREKLTTGDGGSRWITRTWWSGVARDDDWWAAFTRGDVPPETGRESSPQTRSRAFILLAALGRETPSLSLSGAECARLAPLVEQWFERGATEATLTHALTDGLPVPVHCPAALLHNRLTTKLPPPRPVPPPPVRLLECTRCGLPGRPEHLPGGVCRGCTTPDANGSTAPGSPPPAPLSAPTIHAHAAGIRAEMSRRRQERTHV